MLGNALDRLDDKLYDAWKKETDSLATLMASGLGEIEFPSPKLKEIEKINEALAILKKKNVSREAYVNAMKILSEQLSILTKNKDFKNNDINNFFFLSHRCAEYLNGSLLTEYNKYFDAFLNPTGKEQPKYEAGFLENKGIGKVARDLTSYILQDYQTQIQSTLVLNVQKLKENPVKVTSQPINVVAQTNMLEAKMGKDQYQSGQSQVKINRIQDVSVYLKEQIYGASFELYYMQVATLFGIISKVESVAIGTNGEEISKERQKLFEEAGFGDLNSKEARIYLNAVANKLGFDDAKDLHQNYQKLETDQGAQLFIQYKQSFVEFSNIDIPANDDPLNDIKDLVQNENTRLNSKVNTPFFNQANTNYIKIVNYTANELLRSIKKAQRIANITKIASEDASKMMGDNLGFWGNVGMFAANWQKHRIDSYALSGLTNDGALLLNKINDDAQSINQIWIERTNERIKERRENRDKIIKKANNNIDGSNLVTEYINTMIIYKKTFQEYNAAQNFDKNSTEYAAIHERFKSQEEKYNNYKDAFSLCANDNIFKLTPQNIEESIKERDKKISVLGNAYTKKVNELGQLKDQLNAQTNRRYNTFGGRLARWRDNTAAFFGITTKSKQAIDDNQKKYNTLYAELEPLGLELQIQMQLLSRTKKLHQKFQDANNQSAAQLINTIRLEMNNLSQSYKQIKSYFESSSDDKTSVIFNHQEELRVMINNLSILTNQLITKFNSENDATEMSVLNLEEILHEVTAAHAEYNKFNPLITGIKTPFSINFDGVIENLSKIIERKKIIAQNTLLEKAKKTVSEAYKNASVEKLINPFSYALALPDVNVGDLNSSSRELLEEHISNEASSLLTRMNDSIALKDLEKIYVSLQTQANKLANKNEKTQHDLNQQNHYQMLADSVKQSISVQLKNNNSLSLPELRNTLPKLSSEVLHSKNIADSNMKNAKEMSKIVDSWIWNALGIITHEKVESTLAQAQATDQLQQIYSTEFTTTLKSFLKNAQGSFEAFEYGDLKEFIAMISATFEELKSNNISMNCTNAMEELLREAQRAEQSHTHHLQTSIHQDLTNIESQIIEINKVRNQIDNEITVSTEANLELISKFNTMLARINSDIDKAKSSISDLNKIRSQLTPKYKALGVTTFEEENLAIIFQKRLGNVSAALGENEKNIARNVFFADICKGSVPSSTENFSKDVIGKGLLMSLAHDNIKAASFLLNSQNTKETIDVFVLGSALPLAAKIGNLDLIVKIINYNNAVFNQDALNNAFQASLLNEKQDIVNYIVFNSDFMPDSNSIKLIERLMPYDSPISSVDRGILQIFSDNDGVKLEDMRKGYSFLEQLASSIQSDLSEIEKRTNLSKASETSDAVKVEINKILKNIAKIESLKESISSQYNALYFDTPSRRINHIQKWNSEIDKELDGCHKAIQRLLNPKYVEPLIPPVPSVIQKAKDELSELAIFTPPNVLADIQDEKTKRDVRVQLTQLQNLVENGAIMPSTLFTSPTANPNPTAKEPVSEKLVSKQIDSATTLVNIENSITTLLHSSYLTPKQLAEFKSQLNEYLHEGYDDKERINIFLQKALYQLVKDNKSQAITILLDVTKDFLSQDILANALSQAIQSNSRSIAFLLIEHQAFIGHENDILSMLLDKLDKTEFSGDRSLTNEILFVFLLHAKNAILIDPYTQKLDDRIQKFVASQIDLKKESKIPPASKSWGGWVKDNDGPKLSHMRDAYVFAEQALAKLEYATYIDHLQKMLEINNQIDLPSQMEISLIEKELARLEENYETQLNLIANVLTLYKNIVEDSKFDNLTRKDNDLAKWDSTFSEILTQHKSRFKKDIENAKKELQECKAESVKLAKPDIERRKSALISTAKQAQGHKNELEPAKTDAPNMSPSSPSKVTNK